ncbi:histidine triad (HIT) family protein [Microbacterium sp. W4I4]|uniref:HIT family protein n=1 Tax=Microbacterium sp. W4I4 TaxID=3042295 RepID=UPI0027851D34|nr:HIT family protein [Microbacterium sp. W4I4]MDQ0612874.1 histidine triad (HIT) family protein [Microbacterium sp. W4I4]
MPATSHEPEGYDCPFCRLQLGVFNERNRSSDVIAVTDHAYARIAPKWWPDNPGAVLVMPRAHIENIYDLPTADGHAMWDLVQRVATSMRTAYGCEGTSLRQHNEPAGNQDVWHLHVHVFPRYENDRLYQRHEDSHWVGPSEREPYALKLRGALGMPYQFDI